MKNRAFVIVVSLAVLASIVGQLGWSAQLGW